jgi:membrane-bound lytic murein transglycosylase A
MKARFLLAALFFLSLAGCAVSPVQPVKGTEAAVLVKLSGGDIPVLVDDLDAESLDTAVARSLEYLDKRKTAGFRTGDCDYTAADMREGLLGFRDIVRTFDTAEDRMKKIRDGFDVYKASGSDGKGAVLFTGYYEPVLNGSLEATDRYRYPIYRVPADLPANGTTAPYLSRREIDGGQALAGRGLEIAWVDDPVELFFLHIQGSGMIKLPDGHVIQVSFARSNDRPFRGIGRYMAEKGILSQQGLSNQRIKKYLRDHPDEQTEIFYFNERYIFFRIVNNGPVGALGVTVTGGRTIAVDPVIYPQAGLAFIRLRKPVLNKENGRNTWVPFSRFVLAQDVGAAIKGPGRIDLFCGGGEEAELVAGSLKEKGELYFLVKKKAGCGP